jgi:predicted  nucleic acid-binding Zn-ribbon protein
VGLLQRLKHDLRTGLATLRFGTAQAASRALEETELLRLRLEIRKLDQQLSDLYKDIGERAVDMKERGETAERVVFDAEIVRLVRDVQAVKDSRKKLEVEMHDIRNER